MPPRSLTHALLRCALPLFAAQASAAALAAEVRSLRLGNDTFVMGDEVELRRTIAGDAIVGAGRVVLDATVAGDAIVSGGQLTLGGDVGEDMYAAGGRVDLASAVAGNARVAGGEVRLLRSGRVAQGLSAAGGRIAIDGEVGSYAQLVGSTITIDGHVDGDVYVVGAALRIGPAARIDGDVTFRGPQAAQIEPGATILGPVRNIIVDRERWQQRALMAAAAIAGIWFVGWTLAGALLIAVFPRATRRVTETARSRPALALLIGALAALALPALAAFLLATVVGIPLAILAVLLYLLLVPLGYLAGVATTGDWLLHRRAHPPPRTLARVGMFVLMLIVVTVLVAIPLVGWLAGLLLWLLGMGAILLAPRRGPGAAPASA